MNRRAFLRQPLKLAIAGAALLPLLSVLGASAAEVSVAAASDLKFAMDEIIARYQRQHTNEAVKVTYGSSGNFFAQIQNGAPFDLYFSADISYPERLAAAGFAFDTNAFHYAVGRIVIWAPNRSALKLDELGMRALLDPGVKKVAIANPRHAPYGVAAVAAMKTAGIYDSVEPRLVLGENVTQAAQFVETGAADAGVIALSLALAPRMKEQGRHWIVPIDSYPRLVQGGIILKSTRAPAAARQFRDYVLGEQGSAILRDYGFFLPGK